MNYKIVRIDGKHDNLSIKKYKSYDEAYLVLERLFGSLCCSDTDFGLIPDYVIVESR